MAETAFFCGPHNRAGLQQLLIDSINAVPSSGEVLWSTYYLANRRVVTALKQAAARGVRVNVAIEARPRMGEVNREAIHELSGRPNIVLRLVASLFFSHLHEKLYYFSHPSPFFLAGSYNPSMDENLDDKLLAEIGDQDNGHNLLVRFTEPKSVTFVRDHLLLLSGQSNPQSQMTKLLDQGGEGPSVYFFPLGWQTPHISALAGDWDTITIAMSHVRDKSAVRILCQQARRGCLVNLISHDSRWRFPFRNERELKESGVGVWRYSHPAGYPMHSKFMLFRKGGAKRVLLGSVNLTRTSRWLNKEVLVQTSSTALYSQLEENWKSIRDEIANNYR